MVSLPLALAPTGEIFDHWVMSMSILFANNKSINFHQSPQSRCYQTFPQSEAGNLDDAALDFAPTPVPDWLRYVSRFFLLVSCSFLAGHVPCFELVIDHFLSKSDWSWYHSSGHIASGIIYCVSFVFCPATSPSSRADSGSPIP